MKLDGKPLPPEAREIFAACLLLAWRAWEHPASGLWRDWFTLLCLFWIAAALGSKRKSWPCVALGVMAFLLVLYGWRQVPVTLHALGSLP